jgi:hypothetical protein
MTDYDKVQSAMNNKSQNPGHDKNKFTLLSLAFGILSVITFGLFFLLQEYYLRSNNSILSLTITLAMIASLILAVGLGIAGIKQTGGNSYRGGRNCAITGLVLSSLIILYFVCASALVYLF